MKFSRAKRSCFVALFALFLISATAHAGLVETCGQIDGANPYTYCVTRDDQSRSAEVLYYLHGGGGNEHGWKSFVRLHEVWARLGLQAPVVITISFGPAWLLVNRSPAPQSGLLEAFRDRVIPQMEALALGRPAQKRLLFGASMGGFNSAQVLMGLPEGTFARAYLACPAMIPISPWASKAELDIYLANIGEKSGALDKIIALVKAFVPDEKTWTANVNPITAIPASARRFPPTLVSVNTEDLHFGPGGAQFAVVALRSGAPVNLQTWQGHHCQMTADNVETVAKFLLAP